MNNIKVVVARYNEDIAWTKHFKPENIIIYNKGNDNINEYKPIKLPTVGREGHTYYKYIYDNYENLPDYTIFVQGYPFDHTKNIIEDIHHLLYKPDLNEDFLYLSTVYAPFTFEKGCGYLSIQHLNDTYEKIFGCKNTTGKQYAFATGAQFMVKRETILKKPKEFYRNIVNMLSYSINPIEGYGLERLHKIIFTE